MSVEKRIEDQPSLKDEVKRVAKTTKEELMYYSLPFILRNNSKI